MLVPGTDRLALGEHPIALPPAARAHERKAAGGFRLTIGWGDEPAFSGFRNPPLVAADQAALGSSS